MAETGHKPIKPLDSLYKQAYEILDRKTRQ